jgi:carbon-monoxide dehydrogenase medium subunit
MTLSSFALMRPTTVAEAVECLSEDAVPYCGGTELLLAMRAGLHRPGALVDIKRITDLRGVQRTDGTVRIGATTTHAALAADPVVREHLPMLAGVEQAVGNARVRAQGSIAGNLCFAEPKSDVGAALVALRANVMLSSPRGEREIPVEDLLKGAYFADREPDELLVHIDVPVAPGRRAVYLKYQTAERPTAGVAVVHESGHCRIVVGAVGEVPYVWDGADPEDADADAIAAGVDPITDLTGSERYKRHVTEVYVRRALTALTRRLDD